jgi:hypothetical protein
MILILQLITMSFILDYYISPLFIKKNRVSRLIAIDALVWSTCLLTLTLRFKAVNVPFWLVHLMIYRILSQVSYGYLVPKELFYKETKNDITILELINITVIIVFSMLS